MGRMLAPQIKCVAVELFDRFRGDRLRGIARRRTDVNSLDAIGLAPLAQHREQARWQWHDVRPSFDIFALHPLAWHQPVSSRSVMFFVLAVLTRAVRSVKLELVPLSPRDFRGA